jgi:hypothetical protein
MREWILCMPAWANRLRRHLLADQPVLWFHSLFCRMLRFDLLP